MNRPVLEYKNAKTRRAAHREERERRELEEREAIEREETERLAAEARARAETEAAEAARLAAEEHEQSLDGALYRLQLEAGPDAMAKVRHAVALARMCLVAAERLAQEHFERDDIDPEAVVLLASIIAAVRR